MCIMKTKYYYLAAIILSIAISGGCKKQDEWLNAKTQKSDVAPETVADFQALLDNTDVMNQNSYATAGLSASDNIFVLEQDYGSVGEFSNNVYIWARQPWVGGNSNQWNNGFAATEFANICIDGLAGIKSGSGRDPQYENVLGQAYFHRAVSTYNLMNTFCKAYDKSTALTDLGLPLRTTSDVNIIVRTRASVQETYEFAINDLKTALGLLSDKQTFFQRPSKNAARAYLAKIYLNMGQYQAAFDEADKILKTHSSLLDYNGSLINYGSTYRFPVNGIGNPEIIYYARSSFDNSVLPRTASLGIIPPELYNQYNNNDLRKKAFFVSRNGYPRFIGCYTGTLYSFSGIAVNELYLIRSECAARLGRPQEALDDLNLLLKSRYASGTFSNYTLTGVPDIVGLILAERRKELPFTANIRGEDLRRLNKDPKYQTIIKRIVNGQEISIMPDDSRYTFPIPDNEIQMSGIPQN